MRSPANLPNDVESLMQLVLQQQSAIELAHAELADVRLVVEKLRFELARLKRLQYGRSSEAHEEKIAQLELILEELEAAQGHARCRRCRSSAPGAPSVRRPLPANLPREEMIHPVACACPTYGATLRSVGEDVPMLPQSQEVSARSCALLQ